MFGLIDGDLNALGNMKQMEVNGDKTLFIG